MKKKQRCFIKRFAALVAALVISLALPVSALAASDTEADMPTLSDFYGHQGSWFVWRTYSHNGKSYYELLSSPLTVSGDSYTLPWSLSYSSSPFEVSCLSDSSGSHYYYACCYPFPLRGATGLWSSLPSFPVGSLATKEHCSIRVYSTSEQSADTYFFLTPVFSFSDRVLSSGNTSGSSSGSSFDSLGVSSFSSPFYSYPFSCRESGNGYNQGFVIQGGDNAVIVPPSQLSRARSFGLESSRLLTGFSSFSSYPSNTVFPSSNLGFVFVKKPSGSYIVTNPADFSATGSFAFSLIVPVAMLPDTKIGDWLSDSPENLQDVITKEFDVDSDKLKDSKDSLNSWNSTSSVDTDLANTSLSTINALFQNLGQFLAIVSLMVFGAVVLRMLIRKAVDG